MQVKQFKIILSQSPHIHSPFKHNPWAEHQLSQSLIPQKSAKLAGHDKLTPPIDKVCPFVVQL